MPKVKVTKIKVGDCVGTPGDHKVRTVWGRVDKVKHDGSLVLIASRDWATESSKKYGDGFGHYTARASESLLVSDTKCKRPTLGRRRCWRPTRSSASSRRAARRSARSTSSASLATRSTRSPTACRGSWRSAWPPTRPRSAGLEAAGSARVEPARRARRRTGTVQLPVVNFLDERLPQRFWDKVTPCPMSGCWLWVAGWTGAQKAPSTCRGDYGVFRWHGDVVNTHILSYEVFVGVVPDGMQVDHKCRVRCCCRPDHLEAVTQRVNVLRGVGASAVHARKVTCPKGHPYDSVRVRRDGTVCRFCWTCRDEKMQAASERWHARRRLTQPSM